MPIVLPLASRTKLQHIALDLGQGLLFASLIYFWRGSGLEPSALSIAGLALLYVAGNLLITPLLFVVGLVQIARRRSG